MARLMILFRSYVVAHLLRGFAERASYALDNFLVSFHVVMLFLDTSHVSLMYAPDGFRKWPSERYSQVHGGWAGWSKRRV